MPIPVTLAQPQYPLTLPICRKKINFRPFVEGERKVLLMALEANDPADITTAIFEILKSCCLSKIDIDSLTTVDIEFFFLNLRAKSMGEIVPLNFRCEPCSNIMRADVDITTASVTEVEFDSKIVITPTIVIKMKYPSFKDLEDLSTFDTNDRDYIYGVLTASVDYIASGDNIYYAKDYPREDTLSFLLTLTPTQLEKVQKFLETFPTLSKKLELTCKKCGFKHDIVISGYQSFFV